MSQTQQKYLKQQQRVNSMDDEEAKSLPPLILGLPNTTYKDNAGSCRMGYLWQCILCYGPESVTTLCQRNTSHCIQQCENLHPHKTAAVLTF